MDLEAMQFLNLSPIPELSEIELSTMLDHLSGLSDINGDLTDRNVEDIIKEAEDLLDKSTNSKISEVRGTKGSPEQEKKASPGYVGSINEDISSLKDSEVYSNGESNSNEIKNDSSTVNEVTGIQYVSNEEDNRHFNTPVESTPTKVCSPCGTMNHIKSTIDSLKEFSTLVEKKLNSQNSVPKCNKKTEQSSTKKEQDSIMDSSQSEKSVNIKQAPINSKIKIPDLTMKKNESVNKSIKLLNCFERLYQVRPLRLSSVKRPKVTDKTPKATIKKKVSKDIKNVKKNNQQGKILSERVVSEERKNLNYCLPSNNSFPQVQISKNTNEHLMCYCLDDSSERNNYGQIQSRIGEKLILKVLKEMEEIKDQVRKVGAYPGKKTEETILEPETDTTEVFTSKNSGIKRLEQQFAALKEKYDYQMEKLEAENCQLREALIAQEKHFPQQSVLDGNKVLRSPQSDKKASRCASLENCKAPRNSPCSSSENVTNSGAPALRDAFCQTDDEPKSGRREVGTDAGEIFTEGRKTENKENVAGGKKKLGGKCCKPFLDVSQSTRQKKIVEHETQLLATLRGLQAEVTARDKENRKLRSEMESMRKQMKKVTVPKESWRKCHAGSQTIALGPIVQKPYNPEIYGVPQEFERENEDLRSRIKTLEEDVELLKEKRIADLQALHQVHEEEMAKLVSKLETQSALTRHLHSLLVNR